MTQNIPGVLNMLKKYCLLGQINGLFFLLEKDAAMIVKNLIAANTEKVTIPPVLFFSEEPDSSFLFNLNPKKKRKIGEKETFVVKRDTKMNFGLLLRLMVKHLPAETNLYIYSFGDKLPIHMVSNSADKNIYSALMSKGTIIEIDASKEYEKSTLNERIMLLTGCYQGIVQKIFPYKQGWSANNCFVTGVVTMKPEQGLGMDLSSNHVKINNTQVYGRFAHIIKRYFSKSFANRCESTGTLYNRSICIYDYVNLVLADKDNQIKQHFSGYRMETNFSHPNNWKEIINSIEEIEVAFKRKLETGEFSFACIEKQEYLSSVIVLLFSFEFFTSLFVGQTSQAPTDNEELLW